jgi:hypothetical protein
VGEQVLPVERVVGDLRPFEALARVVARRNAAAVGFFDPPIELRQGSFDLPYIFLFLFAGIP